MSIKIKKSPNGSVLVTNQDGKKTQLLWVHGKWTIRKGSFLTKGIFSFFMKEIPNIKDTRTHKYEWAPEQLSFSKL